MRRERPHRHIRNNPNCAPPGGNRDRIHTVPPTCDAALLALWLDYVRETVGRYKDRVHAWEIWNEPGEATFWSGGAGDYARLLVRTAGVIKGVDPGARIVAPATSGVAETTRWLAEMRQAGCQIAGSQSLRGGGGSSTSG